MNATSIGKDCNDLAPPDRDRLAALGAVSDQEIAEAVAADPDAAPITDADWWADAEVLPPRKVPVSLRIDPDILAFFKSQGSGYQTRINAVLRRYMEAQTQRGRR